MSLLSYHHCHHYCQCTYHVSGLLFPHLQQSIANTAAKVAVFAAPPSSFVPLTNNISNEASTHYDSSIFHPLPTNTLKNDTSSPIANTTTIPAAVAAPPSWNVASDSSVDAITMPNEDHKNSFQSHPPLANSTILIPKIQMRKTKCVQIFELFFMYPGMEISMFLSL